jgi:hypothetical protein
MIETDRLHRSYEVNDLGAFAVREALRDAELQDRIAARRKLRLAVQWCVLHPGSEQSHAGLADVECRPFDLPDLHIAGEGTPWVAAGAPDAFAVSLGLAAVSGQAWLADALDLTHRLPRIRAGVEALRVPLHKARKVARMTRALPVEAAAWVDGELVEPLAAGAGYVTIERAVVAAMAAFAPELLAERDRRGKDAWRVSLDHRRDEGWDGTSLLDAVGDTVDLIDFHELVCAVAERLAELGDGDTVGQRRAKALGLIGRGEHEALLGASHARGAAGALVSRGPDKAVEEVGSGSISCQGAGRGRPRVPRRVFLHLDPDQPEVVDVEGFGMVAAETAKRWLNGLDAAVKVTPVVDLSRHAPVDRHDPPAAMREQVIQRDRHCVHPFCEVDARLCDLDHLEPYRPHGPPAQTSATNLAPLCRRGHNLKTRHSWRYCRTPDGGYLWTEPTGQRYLVTPDGTYVVD